MFTVNSLGFPFFVAVLALVWYRTPAAKRWGVMLAAGVVFYLSLDPAGFLALLGSTLVVWFAARRLDGPSRKAWLAAGLAAGLAPLLVLKYSGMFVAGLAGLAQPLGISYYSLQLVGYLLDVWYKRIPPEPRFGRVFCYASFFLSITQGPFNHYADLMPQLARPTAFDGARAWRGGMRMAWGYFQKFAIADWAAVVTDTVFAAPLNFNRLQIAFAVLLFAFRLYADFSGYTNIVLGAGEALGLALPENFRQPYLALSVGDFWSRWHISLSSWLQEYIFEPLAWSGWTARLPAVGRYLTGQPVLSSLMITFLVSGLWHGAAWNFVAWGALNGFYQVVSAWTRRRRKKIWKRLGVSAKNPLRRWWQRGFVFFWICVGYVFFVAGSLHGAFDVFRALLQNGGTTLFSEYWLLGLSSRLDLVRVLAGVAVLVAVDLLHERGAHLRDWVLAQRRGVRWAVYEVAIFAFLLMGQFMTGGGFLYARF